MNRSLPHFLVALGSKFKTFKNLSALAVVLLLFSGGAWGQVTTNSSSGLSPTYPTLAAAITALNGATITAPVTITLTASNPQTAPAGGYSITATGTITNTITITGNSNTITAPSQTTTPTAVGNLNDAIFKIIGGDYITIQGFTMQERSFTPVAADTTAATNTMTEIGVALFYASTTNGAQNNIIQNNTISLNRAYQNTFGILASSRSTAIALTSNADATSASGANSYNKIYTNAISNVNYAIVFLGSSTIAGMDTGNDIGGSSAGTGNTITDFCTSSATAPSSYVNLTGSNYAIFLNHNLNSNVSYNNITSATSTLTNTLGGILQNFSVTAAAALGTTVSAVTINNNTFTLSRSAAGPIFGINNQGVTSVGTTSSTTINNNLLLNPNITVTGTSNVTGFVNSSITGVLNMNGNTVRGITSAASAGQIIGVQNTAAVITSINMDNNKCGDATAGYITYSAANSGLLLLAGNSGGASTCAVSMQNNDIRGVVYSVASTANNTYIQQTGAVASANVSNNTFTNLSVNTTGTVLFINHGYTMPAGGSQTISGNSIVTAFNKTGAGGTVTIASSASSSPNGSFHTFTNNNFSNITVTGATAITGVSNSDGSSSSPTRTVTGNTFNNWIGGTGAITGLSYSYIGGTTSSFSSNTFTNITGQAAITVINLGSSANLATTVNVSSNTINNLSSTGTGGQVLAIACANTSSTININGNAINTLSSTAASSAVGAITVFGAATTNVYQNVIYDISTSGATAPVALGIQVAGGTLVNVYSNKIYNLSASGSALTSSASAVSGIYLNGGTTVNTYNNLIGNLTAPNVNLADAIRGINIISTTASTSYNVYNNTVYLTGGSVGTNFGTSGIYHTASATATTAALDLQNNMIFNTCTPSGTGIVSAFRRSASTLGNYKSTSNKNLFYAGTPSATTTIMSDGTNNYQTLATFQTAVSTREANSFTESAFTPSTYFVSTTASNANYLQPASGITTQAEGGGNTITMCSPDYNGVTRPGFSGAAYDVGAWEFAGVSPAPVLTSMSPSPALTTQCTKAARAISIDITTTSGTINGATLNYNHNGAAQTAVTMTNSSGNTWTGTMLAPSTGNATVTWSITAINSLGLSTLYNGTSYADEPNTGITASATAIPSTVCEGSNASLSMFTNNSGFSTLGTGTLLTPGLTGGADDVTAFNNYRLSYKMQTIYTAAELTAIGLRAGNITSIAYNINSNGSSTTNSSFIVKIGNTTQSTLTDFASSTSFTTVYPSATFTHAIGWNTINFSTPYNWDGSSNIIIEITHSGANSSYSAETYYTATTGNMVATSYNGTTTGTLSTKRLNTKFGGMIATTPNTISWSNGTTTLGTTNPLSTPIASGLTYTATATVNGCPISAAVTPTVLPLPTAPTATPSSQCGAGVPSASVADNNSYTTPTFKWYSANTGGTALQSSASTTYTTSISATTTFYVAVVGTNACESARTAVTVTVSQPDAISAVTSASAICLGQSVTLTAANIATTPTQTYSYSWACATTGSGATSANTNNPASITPTAAGSYAYTVTATDGACSAENTVAVTVNALPNITSATATPSTVCSGAAITLTGVNSTSANYVSSRTAPTILSSTTPSTYGLVFNVTTAFTLNSVDVFNGTTSSGTFIIQLQNSAGTVLQTSSTFTAPAGTGVIGTTVAYTANLGWNIPIGTGYRLLVTSGTASLIRESALGGFPYSIGTVGSITSGYFSGTSTTYYYLYNWQVTSGVDQSNLYSWSWNSTPAIATNIGTTSETNTGATATTKTYTVTATNATTGCVNTATTSAVTINPAPVAPIATNSTQCGTLTPTCSVTGTGTLGNTFKWYTVATGGTALVGQSASTLSSYPVATTTSFYVSETNGTCESPRVQVDVTVTAPPTITAGASVNPVCSGSATSLTVSSANSGYTYSWDNSAGTGASVSVNPTSATTYTVTATDNSGGSNNGCSSTASIAITTNALPSAVTLTPSSATICNGSIQSIVASGGSINSSANATLGNGLLSNGTTTFPNPLLAWYGGAKHQMLISATELSAQGLISGSSISSVKFDISAFTAAACTDFTIRMGHTANTALTTFVAGTSTVYGPTTFTPSATGLVTFTFTTPFTWDGTSNVILETVHNAGNSGNGATTTVKYTTTSTNTVYYGAKDNVSGGISGFDALTSWTNSGASSSRPNIVFGYSSTIPATFSWNNIASLFTNPAATTAYTGNPTTVYAKPTSTTTYTATATNASGCTSSNTVTVTVNPTSVAGTVSADQAICTGSSPSDITLSGYTGTIQWQVSSNNTTFTNIPGAIAATLTSAQMGALSATRYYRAVVTSGACTAANSSAVTVTVNPLPTALVLTGSLACAGATGTITSSTSVSGVDYQLYDSSNATVGAAIPGTGAALSWSSVAIANGYYAKATNTSTTCVSANSNAVNVGTVTTKTWTATSGNWSTASNWSCGILPTATDVIVISSGSPVLDTNFTVGATGSLTISGSGTFTIGASSTLTIEGATNFGGKAVTIKSNATGNGAIGQVTGTLSGATNVTVERYIPAKRSWRAITAPLKGSNSSVFSQWQNNGNSSDTTIGVELWGPNGTGMNGNGLAVGPSNSILQYNNTSTTSPWTAVTDTKTTNLFTTSGNNAFMVFPTGGYGSGNILSSSTASASTLKATGQLITGQVTYTNLPNLSHTLIGNPYASPLDPAAVITSNASLGGTIWVWDANTLGSSNVGCYNLFNVGAYSNITGSLAAGVQIQSGQAFFVKPPTNLASFTIEETHKSSAWNNAVFRTAAPELLRVGLYKQANNEWLGRDGAMTVILADANANQLPNKMANGTENIVFTKNGGNFASNHHLPLVASDVLNVKVWNTTAGANYKLKINTEQFATTNLDATLEDLFTNARTPLALDGTAVEYPFTVTTDALSTGDRFRIVFQTAALSTNNPKANGFSIVPNPVTGDAFQVNLGTLATGTYTYSICNAIGQEVEKGSINNAAQNTNYTVKFRESAATGMYIMKIKGSDNSVFTAKIIKK